MGRIIDIFTGKEIPADPQLSVSQSLEKTKPVQVKDCIDFVNPENNSWNEVRYRNELLTPLELIDTMSKVLADLQQGKEIDKSFCAFLQDQCANWIETDTAVMIE